MLLATARCGICFAADAKSDRAKTIKQCEQMATISILHAVGGNLDVINLSIWETLCQTPDLETKSDVFAVGAVGSSLECNVGLNVRRERYAKKLKQEFAGLV
jgi:hypothetical protein